MHFPDNPLWDFALLTYGSPGVPEACLALQEVHHVDVNLLLACSWLGHTGRRVDPAQLNHMIDTVSAWHDDIVRNLRLVRRRLKELVDGLDPDELQLALRARIQKIEIDAEHLEQLRLAAVIDRMSFEKSPSGSGLAADNMAAYIRILGAGPTGRSLNNVRKIAAARAADTES